MVERREPTSSIVRAIEERGPISFAEFMELALYGPGGFYEEPPVGERGHFVTSPHVHPVFGQLLGAAIRQCWSRLGEPRPLQIVEVGAGDGTLAVQVRHALSDVPKHYVAVERSEGARRALRGIEPPGIRVAASLEELDQRLDGLLVANELLDNLPFRWIRRTDEWLGNELLVTRQDARFAVIEEPVDDPEVLTWIDRVPIGGLGVFPEGALHFVDRLARSLRRGFAILIDYAAGPVGVVHGYRRHRAVEDVLRHPGSADITVGVDFELLAGRAALLGLHAARPVTQRSALRALGYDQWAERERRRQAAAQDRRSGREAVLAWSERNAAHLLVDPAGLGGLRWLVLSAGGVRPPGWHAVAWRLDIEDGLAPEPEPEPEPRAPERRDVVPVSVSTGPGAGFMAFVDVPRRLWSFLVPRRLRARRARRRLLQERPPAADG
jgi:SAM-dependent MidA family methyltransferase